MDEEKGRKMDREERRKREGNGKGRVKGNRRHTSKFSKGYLAGDQFPQNESKGVDISLLRVNISTQSLRGSIYRSSNTSSHSFIQHSVLTTKTPKGEEPSVLLQGRRRTESKKAG